MSEAEGRAEAVRRIAVARETRARSLDLSGLMLTALPDEIGALEWLEAARSRKVLVHRDQDSMQYGDRISKFMARLVRGKRVYVIITDKYLRSPYCMHELFGIWQQCKKREADLTEATRIFVHESARIGTDAERAEHFEFWKRDWEEREALIMAKGTRAVSEQSSIGHRLAGLYYQSVTDILHEVQDTLRARTFDEFLKHGFADVN